MSLDLNLLETLKKQDSEQIVREHPYFELAHISLAIAQNTTTTKHNAALLLQNNLWFQYLNTVYKQKFETVSSVKKLEAITPVLSEKAIETKESFTVNVEANPETTMLTEQNQMAAHLQPETIVENSTTAQADNTDEVVLENEANEMEAQQNEATELPLPTMKNADALKELLGAIKQPKAANEPAEINTQPIDIEPVHAVDYFGSQGIKVSNIAAVDRLTVQLRSFTQWLKTMKKVEALSTTVENPEELKTHHNVVNMAEKSVLKAEILTENMVDVLIKQGKTNDAIGLLQKLSLQEPEKSVYFAAQIEKIKKLYSR